MGDDARIQPRPSFSCLPDIAHASIASFLPDGNRGSKSCLRVSEVSRALLEPYGGSLTKMHIFYKNSSAARLAALLQRQEKLVSVNLHRQETIPALCLAIVDGCCRGIEVLKLRINWETTVTAERSNLLAAALEKEETQSALSILNLHCAFAPGEFSKVARALKGGNSPLLQQICLRGTADFTEHDLASFADMLEARARIPQCKRLQIIDTDHLSWFDKASLETRVRILRALLPSVKEMVTFTWAPAFESCFLEVQATYLTALGMSLEGEGTVFSWNMFEATPALVKLEIEIDEYTELGGPALQSISAALRHGLLRTLQEMHLHGWCDWDDGDVRDLMDAFEVSGCSKRLTTLSFSYCEIGAEGVRTVAELLCRDALPELKALYLHGIPDIADGDVKVLAGGLLKATQTYVTALVLSHVGMGDDGIAALTSLVSQGHIRELKVLDILGNASVTYASIPALSEAINTRGLPMLGKFFCERVKSEPLMVQAIGAIAQVIIEGRPRLKEIEVGASGCIYDRVKVMVQAAGRAEQITVC